MNATRLGIKNNSKTLLPGVVDAPGPRMIDDRLWRVWYDRSPQANHSISTTILPLFQCDSLIEPQLYGTRCLQLLFPSLLISRRLAHTDHMFQEDDYSAGTCDHANMPDL